MNKANLKSYAPQARKDFIATVTARANLLGLSEKAGQLEVAPAQTQGDITIIAGQPWPAKVAKQREKLITRMQREGFKQTCDAVAYTWFNRFAALRFMELHDYLGHGHRALSSAEGTLPDLLTHAVDLAQAGDTGLPGLKASLVKAMKLAGNRDGELYRMLLIAQCNALNAAMPFLFERIDDDTELLLPDNLLRTDSVIAKLVQEIPEEDWAEVEIIGWLYQFYISEKKDQVIGKVVKSEDIPAATQLFTPNWIVQYLVQNSVGRLWLMANPTSTLASQWPYYIRPAEQTPEVQAQLDALIHTRMSEDGGSLNPETITVLDPACGSGHILVVAYDVLKAIYLERGYQPRTIPRLILEKNLYGLDIDDRAAQMASFALLMKARADDRRLFNEPPKLNVLSLQESKGLDAAALAQALNSTKTDRTELVEVQQLRWLIDTFEYAKTFGSLIQIDRYPSSNLRKLLSIVQQAMQAGDLYAQAAAQDVLPLVQQALVLGMQFDAVVANPPYMGNGGMCAELKTFARQNYEVAKSDLFSMFVVRSALLGRPHAFCAMVTMHAWMFISTFEEFRTEILNNKTIATLAHIGFNSFPELNSKFALAAANVFFNSRVVEYVGTYLDLNNNLPTSYDKCLAFHQRNKNNVFEIDQSTFQRIPGVPIAYWTSDKLRHAFDENKSLGTFAITRKGMVTADNSKYVRYWWEISSLKMGIGFLDRASAKLSGKKWFPYNKGGGFRRWYGNRLDVVNWESDGQDLQTNKHPTEARVWATNFNLDFIFKPNVNWGAVCLDFSARYSSGGDLFDAGGSAAFPSDIDQFHLLAFLNSKVTSSLLAALNPTLNFQSGNIADLPVVVNGYETTSELAKKAVQISRNDWNFFESSYEFIGLSIARQDSGLSDLKATWLAWKDSCVQAISVLAAIESDVNTAFISAYGLQDELTPEVPEDQITLARADREKDCQRLISYAIGCMMGRYSLDEPGLIYAHAGNVGFDASRYATFPADADGIVPLTDELWFTDDAASRVREFLLAVWGADTLEENMAWLAESLGTKASETPDETIRRYLADKFFKDHLQTYKKRPIYWLFSSGKHGAFQALVYLHRYTEGTLSRLRAEYVVPLTGKMQSRIDMLQKDATAASSTAARNKLNKEVENLKKKHAELIAYDEQLRHYADMRIILDLDDGVKVNYGKFGNLLDSVKAVTGGVSDE